MNTEAANQEATPTKPRVFHDYLFIIGPDENTSDILAYFREEELPNNLAFLHTSPIPRKAAYPIPAGVQLHQLMQELLVKAGLTTGHIMLMDLRDFSDYFDRIHISQLKLIDGFTFKVFNAKEEQIKKASGIDFC